MQHHNLQHILCSDAHEGGKYLSKKGPKTHKIQDGGTCTWKLKMAAIFVKKFVYVFTDPQMDRSFVESIKNLQRFNFLKIFVIPGGMRPP